MENIDIQKEEKSFEDTVAPEKNGWQMMSADAGAENIRKKRSIILPILGIVAAILFAIGAFYYFYQHYSGKSAYEKSQNYFQQGNEAEGMKWMHIAANKWGYADAQFNLALCYFNGTGVDKNITEAVKLLHAAAAQGHALAQYKLGWCYKRGYGVWRNSDKAAEWFSKAAEQGHEMAKKALKRVSEE